MTTIDHAAEAREYLTSTAEMLGIEEFAIADISAKQAIAHAQLALVEQQRIANLIALADVPTGMLTEAHREELDGFFARGNPNWEDEL